MISKHRLELFTDAVLAIILTLMALEIHPPGQAGWEAWREVGAPVAAYLMGFLCIACAWLVSHQFFERMKVITRWMMWWNFLSLFFTSLVPLFIKSIAERPHDVAGAALLIVTLYLATICLSLFRLAGGKHHLADPDFQAWWKKRNRMMLFGLVVLPLQLGLACFFPIAADALVTLLTVLTMATM